MHESADKAPQVERRPESSNLVNVPGNDLAARGIRESTVTPLSFSG